MPTIAPEAVEKRVAPFGSTVVMDCETSLETPVAYSWAKQADSLPTESNVDDEGVITIPNVKGQDSGIKLKLYFLNKTKYWPFL